MKEPDRVQGTGTQDLRADGRGVRSAPPPRRLCVLSVKVDERLRREIDAYAEKHGITRSKAAGEYLDIARDLLREREGIPAERADELIEVIEGLRIVVELLGPPTFGMLRLIAHWAARSGSLKVSEDDLLAEVRAAGADEWEQTAAEAERDVMEARRALME
jgi:hypothetical protein